MMGYDPMEEMGLTRDKLFVANSRGFLVKNDGIRDLCVKFLRNGGHFYDVLCRYDELTAYVLGREEASAGSPIKWVLPFLKAHGATDNAIYQHSKESLNLMPSAKTTIQYISKLMPAFITTADLEQTNMPLEDALEAPLCDIFGTVCELDSSNFGRMDSRKLREMAADITSLRIPKKKYEINVSTKIDPDDINILKTLDDIFKNRLQSTPGASLMENSVPVFAQSKAFRLLEIRRSTSIDLEGTIYFGSEHTDYQAMYLVNDCKGVAVSFNGSDFAVRGSNVAVMSNDSTVGAFLTSIFFDKGYQHVIDMANNWDRKSIRNADVMDPHLRDFMLERHPRKLPEVVAVDRHNVDAIAEKSEAYRKKVLSY